MLHKFSGLVPSNGKLVGIKGYNEKGEKVPLNDLAYKYDENGNKNDEVEDFFWKVLTDRRMFGNQGQYLPQRFVNILGTTTDPRQSHTQIMLRRRNSPPPEVENTEMLSTRTSSQLILRLA